MHFRMAKAVIGFVYECFRKLLPASLLINIMASAKHIETGPNTAEKVAVFHCIFQHFTHLIASSWISVPQ